MRALHDSRASQYRTPFGAAQQGGVVTLRVDVWDDPGAKASIRTWVDGAGEAFLPMTGERADDGRLTFTGEVPCEVLGPNWYCFVLEGSDGRVWYYGAQQGRTGGVGQMYENMPPSFQITVYRERPVKPDWYRQGMVYQIFPDRFKRGADWPQRVADAFAVEHKAPETRSFRDDWDAPVYYDRDEMGGVRDWAFYGGTLEGIREELGSLAEQGYTAIYLNPIFESLTNHRYDTANYLKVDPMLGDEESFRRLCDEAAEHGISVILDGVFNHTGTDSVYFNKFGTYPEAGAWQGKESPYYPWYLIREDGSYTCWWGVNNMPDTDKSNPEWQDFVYGEDGVVEHWLKLGARGWRLDVADELNDPFIAGIKRAEDRVKPDALLLGEVWEDASHKVAYGEMRRYLCGEELDSVMNYPFREALLNFLTGTWPAEEMAERMASLKENYPPDAFYETLNLLGSHDRTRLLTVLGGAPDADALSDDQRRWFRLSEGQLSLAKGRLWLAALVQMCSPGVPCVYYGDDAGVQGYTDPYNRSTYPWGHEDEDAKTIYRNARDLRRRFDLLVNGDFKPFSMGPEVYAFWRYHKRDEKGNLEGTDAICVLVNRSLDNVHEVRMPHGGMLVDDLVNPTPVRVEGDQIVVSLRQLGSAVLYFHEPSVLAKPFERGSGIMAHVTSLPRMEGQQAGPGTLGPEAYRFVDFLEGAHQKYWQILPVNPTDKYGSPYAGLSAFAGEPNLVDRDGASWERLYAEWQEGKPMPTGRGKETLGQEAFDAFVKKNKGWLPAYCTFMAARERMAVHAAALEEAGTGEDGTAEAVLWPDWPAPYHDWKPSLARRKELADRVRFHEFQQFLFQVQWDNLKAYANEHGVRIIGDMPIYVSEDSADAWSNRKIFNLDATGHKLEMAGVPGDALAPDGQLWGNPTYDWEANRKDGYRWWLSRLARMFELYDYVRLDHFVGFQNYYAILEGQKPSEGRWKPGPGIELFERAYKKFGPLPVIAEDLGTITPAVRGLMAQCGFPGMDVMEFHGDVRKGYHPAPGKITYTSTHDTNTLKGWVSENYHVTDHDAYLTARHVEETAMRSSADLVVMPLQDVLGLGSEARMNVPGKAWGNWSWQAVWDGIAHHADHLGWLTEQSGRA